MKPDKAKSYGYTVGQALAYIVFTCIAACIAAVCIAGALKIITWLF